MGLTFLKDLKDLELKRYQKLLQIRDTRIRFAQDYHVNTRGEKMNFLRYPHIKALYLSTAAEIVLQGSVQSLKSEWSIIDHFAAAYSGISVFFVFPKYESRNTFVQNRINRCVEQVPEYKKIMDDKSVDNVAMKSFGSGIVKYVGSNVIADFKEFPADVLIVDEVDECDAANIEYGLDRLRASHYQFKRYIGNPRMVGEGINSKFKESDQREWFVPCKKCKEYQQLDWFTTVVNSHEDVEGNIINYTLKDTNWKIGCGRDVYCICSECGGELDRVSTDGRWIPLNPGHPVEGYHISMLCSLSNTIAEMWDDFQKAIYDPLKMQHFYNSYLGLPFTGSGNKVTESMLERCIEEDFNFVIKSDRAHIADDSHEGPCSMGVDVGSNLDVRISCEEKRGRRRALFMGKVRGLEELYDLIDKYNVEKAVMDSMPEISLAQEFQDNAQCDVWLCRYLGEGTDRRLKYDFSNRIVNTDRTGTLDKSFAQLKAKKNILPSNYASIFKGKYVTEMIGPVRKVTSDAKGNSKFEWSKCKDHQRHCDSYDLLAADMMKESVIGEVYVG